MIVWRAWSGVTRRSGVMISTARNVRQDSQVVVEGVILLHHDNDVFDVVYISIGSDGWN
jgi:uncharacterized protein YdeI (BOF family)